MGNIFCAFSRRRSISEPQPILITGGSGQVGGELRRLFPGALTPGRSELDLARPDSIRSFLRAHKPEWILNPAAYTAVDKAESEPALAHAINAEAPRILGEEAVALGASVIHFSTDYVFDGCKQEPYTEEDAAQPSSVYGRTKLLGERALAATGALNVILRTSWVFAPTGRNFLLTVLRVAAERAARGEPMKIVADQHGAPTSAASLARLTAHIVQLAPDLSTRGGVYHATSSGSTTWYEFATEALRRRRLEDPETPFAELVPISTSEYPTPARRPANSRLNCDRLAHQLGYTLPPWQQSLDEILLQLHPAQALMR